MFRNSGFRKDTAGFTLIELLIVIAIIAILSGLILAGISRARNRSQDVRVKSGIRQLRVVAENYYDGNLYTYTDFETCIESPSAANCLDQETVDKVTEVIADMEDANEISSSVDAAADADNFCIAAPLKSSATTYMCVDVTGRFYENDSVSSPCAGAQPVCTFS